MLYRIFLCAFFFINLSIQSCQDRGVSYSEKMSIDGIGWLEGQQLKFDNVVINDGDYLIVRITHQDNYEFENLYLHALIYQDTSIVYDDFFSVPLTNGQGQWAGIAKQGYRLIDYSLNQKITSQKPLQVIIAQYSREPVLKGVEQIELLIKKK